MTTRIVGLERRMMPVGKIRLGDQVESKNGKKRPRVLDKPRLTSSNPILLQHASALYGGQVEPWEDAPSGPRQWELYVEVDAIPILIPPMDTLMQCYETWSAKGCLRRCNNQTIQQAQNAAEIGQPCACPADPEARQALAADGKACKLTTRISCMLPDLPGIGLWVIETHSYYASLWTAGMVEFLESLAKQGRICEAMLRIERQSRKGKNGVRNFAIPTIVPQQMTPRQLFAQEMHQALHPGEPLKLLSQEGSKTLQDHIGDLYGDGAIDVSTGEVQGDPIVTRITQLLQAQGLSAPQITDWWAKMDQKYAGRTPFTLNLLYEQLQARVIEKAGITAQEPGEEALPGPSWVAPERNLFAEEEATAEEEA